MHGQVPPKKGCLNAVLLLDPKTRTDFRDHRRSSCGCESKHTLDSEFFRQGGEAQIFGAEIVPPLRDTVSLVDRKQTDLRTLDLSHECLTHESLGRNVEQLKCAAHHTLIHRGHLGGRESRIQPCSRDSPRHKHIHLILHQRYERRDDQREPLQQNSGKLVAKRFPAAGGKNRQSRASLQQSLHNLTLTRSKSRMAKVALQFGLEILHR